jgi:hypothetical protein
MEIVHGRNKTLFCLFMFPSPCYMKCEQRDKVIYLYKKKKKICSKGHSSRIETVTA